jgi:hypothetical protein
MKKTMMFIALVSLLLIGAINKPVDTIRLTIVNKSGRGIAIQLRTQPKTCCNSGELIPGLFYYLPVDGKENNITIKAYDIEKETYGMQLYYIQTYDPVYGWECATPAANALKAKRDMRLTVLPCDRTPPNVGEPSMRKYLMYPMSVATFIKLKTLFYFGLGHNVDRYWLTRLVY